MTYFQLEIKNRRENNMNELQVIEHSNQRVLLTSQIAEAYGATERRISEYKSRLTIQ